MKPQDTPPLTLPQQVAIDRKLFEVEIITRAWTDDVFRTKLEVDPASALSEIGIPMPKDKAITVITETPDALILVIPPPPVQSEQADDSELEAVAGGVLTDELKAKWMEKMRKVITISNRNVIKLP